jgi:adenosylmethionine-8-amino-7-oxononanoate aminotransferase
VAAFIAEPVMGAGGVIVPPKSYYPKIQALLDRYGIFFIDDEVICGFGRTGKPFGAQALDIKPTTMSVAKAISSAYLPISAVGCTSRSSMHRVRSVTSGTGSPIRGTPCALRSRSGTSS